MQPSGMGSGQFARTLAFRGETPSPSIESQISDLTTEVNSEHLGNQRNNLSEYLTNSLHNSFSDFNLDHATQLIVSEEHRKILIEFCLKIIKYTCDEELRTEFIIDFPDAHIDDLYTCIRPNNNQIRVCKEIMKYAVQYNYIAELQTECKYIATIFTYLADDQMLVFCLENNLITLDHMEETLIASYLPNRLTRARSIDCLFRYMVTRNLENLFQFLLRNRDGNGIKPFFDELGMNGNNILQRAVQFKAEARDEIFHFGQSDGEEADCEQHTLQHLIPRFRKSTKNANNYEFYAELINQGAVHCEHKNKQGKSLANTIFDFLESPTVQIPPKSLNDFYFPLIDLLVEIYNIEVDDSVKQNTFYQYYLTYTRLRNEKESQKWASSAIPLPRKV